MNLDKQMADIEAGIKDAIQGTTPQRAVVPISDADATVRLRCESILQMAFQVWTRHVRGESPFMGPHDMWKLNEIKRLLFSIGESNGEFDRGESK